MMVLDPVKTILRLRAVTQLPESSYIEIGRRAKVVFRRVSYFAVEEIIIIVVSIIVNLLIVVVVADLLWRTLRVSVACRVRLIIAAVEKTVWV